MQCPSHRTGRDRARVVMAMAMRRIRLGSWAKMGVVLGVAVGAVRGAEVEAEAAR